MLELANYIDRELAELSPVYKYISDIVGGINVYDLNTYLGGKIYLVECEEDLKRIVPSSGESLYDSKGVFDVFDDSLDDYVIVSYLENNAGGTLFLIPKRLKNQNVIESCQLN